MNSNNATKIYPIGSQQLIGSSNLRNETPLRITNGNPYEPATAILINGTGMYASGVLANQATIQTTVGGGAGITPLKGLGVPIGATQATLPANNNNNNQYDSNTNQNIGNTNMQLSHTTQKSFLKLNGYADIEQQKKAFTTLIESVNRSRFVEVLGSLASTSAKNRAIRDFACIWQSLLRVLSRIDDRIDSMSFDVESQYPNSEQFISDLVLNSLKEIEAQFISLITTSSLRFLDTVATTHDLQYKHVINIRFDIRAWRKNNLERIKLSQIQSLANNNNNSSGSNKNRNSLAQISYDKDGNLVTKQKSFFAKLCECCLPNTQQSNRQSSSFMVVKQASSQNIKR